MAIDGRGMFLTCKFAIEAMGLEGGSIVCLSSTSGLAGQSNQAVYGPAKFLAEAICFLASDAASFITGAILPWMAATLSKGLRSKECYSCAHGASSFDSRAKKLHLCRGLRARSR